jgi:predicted metal-binding membrane protein
MNIGERHAAASFAEGARRYHGRSCGHCRPVLAVPSAIGSQHVGHGDADVATLDALILCSDLFMLSVMMAGMMLPGTTPMILTFAALRQRHADGTVRRP